MFKIDYNHTHPVEWNNSIYIPTIYKYFNKADIEKYMCEFGKVSRIDFVDLNATSRRVFIHFSETYDTIYMKLFKKMIKDRGYYLMNFAKENKRVFTVKLFINKNPLSPIDNKVNSLKKGLYLSFERLHSLESTIADLKSKVSSLEERLNETEDYKRDDYYDSAGIMLESELNY